MEIPEAMIETQVEVMVEEFAQRISQKAERISSAAVGKNTYTRNGSYSKVISELAAGKVDEEV